MKILYATRLFSGLESSFISGVWDPTGVPTIYKVIEELDRNYETRFIFSAKDSRDGYLSRWNNKKDFMTTISGLNQSIYILSGINFFPTWVARKIAVALRDIRQALIIIISTIKFKPDIIYCDHANIIVAAFLARYQKHTPVVFRAMGIYPFMRKSLTSKNIIHRIYRWSYRSPFSLVICTQDGSGVELWLDQALCTGVESKVLLNGINDTNFPNIPLDVRLNLLPENKIIILFVGKLERYKGCYEFVESIILLIKMEFDKVHALVVGTGSEKYSLNKLVVGSHCKTNFTFIDRLPHEQIIVAHQRSDIYVSMNHLGNLSNANLEAIQSNDCMVIPEPQIDTGIDVITSQLLDGVVVKVPINSPDKLSEVLSELIGSVDKRDTMSRAINIRKKKFLWSWKERIKIETELLESTIKNKN